MPTKVFRDLHRNIRTLDWELFWVLEVVAIAVPFLVAVLTLPRTGAIGHVRLVTVVSVQLGLTAFNCGWMLFRRPQSAAKQKTIRNRMIANSLRDASPPQ
jgi:hypothetical protein